ncbi:MULTISPECIES: cytochrome b [Candidatus Ichthyocystis]|uniref:Putative Cytochrome b561 n=1 Tax=Candidatus Ichthyocystis hellenicum TaxID=1561003 RepID=A0A0S4M5A0_9BURK|nr:MULTISPECIES: cytochrome b [Ichthyocystis]CUT17320.1 putative Cytochrome b561 [Candidatus Ichthyocystis hellenicum]
MVRERYHPLSVVLHWLVALLVVCTGSLGFLGARIVAQGSSWIGNIFLVHKTMGVSIFVLATIRLLVRISYEIAPAKITKLELRLSRAGYALMYFCLFAIPLSGYTVSNANGHSVLFFGTALPRIVSANRDIATVAQNFHMIAAYSFFVVFSLHALMAFKHLFIDRVNLFVRMR